MEKSNLNKLKELHEALSVRDSKIRKDAKRLVPIVERVARAIECLSDYNTTKEESVKKALESLNEVSAILLND